MIFATYGTLKFGYSNHYLLKDAKFLGEWKTNPHYTMYGGGFPIVERGGTDSMQVELYKTDDEHTIHNVNSLEGCTGIQHHEDNWYDFDYLDTPHGKAVIFVMNHAGRREVIKNGLWNKNY